MNPDEDFALPTPQPYPLVKPGKYIGVAITVRRKNYNGVRPYLQMLFDLFDSSESLGCGEQPIARGVPGFFNLGSGSASRYARLLALLFPQGPPRRLRASDLVGKALEVEVITVERDSNGKPLPETSYYSRIVEVVGRVA